MNVSVRLEIFMVLPKRSRQVGNASCDSLDGGFQLIHKVAFVHKPDGMALDRRRDFIQRHQSNEDECSLDPLGAKHSQSRKTIHQRHVDVTDNNVRSEPRCGLNELLTIADSPNHYNVTIEQVDYG